MIIHPIDNLLTVCRTADAYNKLPSGSNRARMQMALKNLEAIPGTGSGPQRAADALQDLATQLNRVAAAIGFPGPQWESVAFPNLEAALLGYAARTQQQAIDAAKWRLAEEFGGTGHAKEISFSYKDQRIDDGCFICVEYRWSDDGRADPQPDVAYPRMRVMFAGSTFGRYELSEVKDFQVK